MRRQTATAAPVSCPLVPSLISTNALHEWTNNGMSTSFKQLLATKRLIRIFSVPRMVHPVLFDVFGLAGGYDGFWLDQEHGGLTYDQIVLASVCARANNFDCFV